METNVISPWETEGFIQDMSIKGMEEIGTERWFVFHKRCLLLYQQSVSEISGFREETVKEWFVTLKKIPILIYEAIQIDIWKHKVFPLIIEMNGEPENTFIIYSILYHENVAISLLENMLFHSDCMRSLEDTVIDLIDYTVKYATILIDEKCIEVYENKETPKGCLEDIISKKDEFEFDIGMRSISILRYIAEFLDALPLSTISRLLMVHDVPYLLVQLIEIQPWKKQSKDGNKMYYDASWQKIKTNDENKICKFEGQAWLGLRELLLNPKCGPYYDISEYRFSQLTKKYLHEILLDQIPPLVDLRNWLSLIQISSTQTNTTRPITVEIIPQIKKTIVEKYNKKWKKIAQKNASRIFLKENEAITGLAKILSAAYDLDKLVCLETKKCFLCDETGTHRCSNCKNAWYCGRKCQVEDWNNHKDICNKLKNQNNKY